MRYKKFCKRDTYFIENPSWSCLEHFLLLWIDGIKIKHYDSILQNLHNLIVDFCGHVWTLKMTYNL